jgi:hypothetical protein
MIGADETKRYYIDGVKDGFFPIRLDPYLVRQVILYDDDESFRNTFWISYFSNPITTNLPNIIFLKQKISGSLAGQAANEILKKYRRLMQIDPLKISEDEIDEFINILKKTRIMQGSLSGNEHPDPEHQKPRSVTERVVSGVASYPKQDENGRWYVNFVKKVPENDFQQLQSLYETAGFSTKLVYQEYYPDEPPLPVLLRKKGSKVERQALVLEYAGEWDREDEEEFNIASNCNACYSPANFKCAQCQSLFCSKLCAINHTC